MIINNKKNIVQVGIIVAVFFTVFNGTIIKLVKDWSVDDNFSHGFLIPFIALYMVWNKKEELVKIEPEPSNMGIYVIVLGLMGHIAGNLGAELFVMRVSMLITLSGIIMFLFGIGIFKELIIPVLYLLLMIPVPSIIWNKIAFPLQLFSAKCASSLVSFLGIPVFREGNILHLYNTSLEVVDACSGIRSLTSLLALSGSFAYLSQLKAVSKSVLFLSAIPIAISVNILRLIITVFAAVYISPETAHGILHDISGIIVFGAALLLTFLAYILINRIENIRDDSREN